LIEHAETEKAGSSAPVAAEATATLLVHVVGSVRRPGVYELEEGDRVVDAIDAAGGELPDAVLEGLNMARKIGDGEQVLVPDEDDAAPVAGVPGATPSGSGDSAPLDINAADLSALQNLPGVGPATAAKIVADREANGPYKSVDDLQRVSGIGPKKLEQFEGLACVR
jgi:competence protein ComEA